MLTTVYRLVVVVTTLCIWCTTARAAKMLIPMDATGQSSHLKAYGAMYAALAQGTPVDWLLNYRGGSYGTDYSPAMEQMCNSRNVSFIKMSNAEYAGLIKKVNAKDANTAIIKLEQAPRIAVYTPPGKKPWDDAVTLALTYAEIPFTKLYASEVLAGDLRRYDWLHLHHEDFTGQYGKFWAQFHDKEWYVSEQEEAQALARKNGYKKVAQLQLAVVKKINAFVSAGGNLFAMCSATDTYDIALAADGVDICDSVFDGDPMSPDAQRRLDYSKCYAFRDFTLVTSPWVYEYSSIDNTSFRSLPEAYDSFVLNSFAVKTNAVPAMLTQSHERVIKGFMGQTTAFRSETLKPGIVVLAESRVPGEARYIHGDHGKGTWTFYGGHDPEDYQHMVNDPVTDLGLHPSSPGYRLILNNVLFAAARRETPAVAQNRAEEPATAAPAGEKPMAQRVKMYPDADNTQLIIMLDTRIKEVVIADHTGKEVYRKTYNTDRVSVDMTGMQPGMYQITVNGQSAGKIVKH